METGNVINEKNVFSYLFPDAHRAGKLLHLNIKYKAQFIFLKSLFTDHLFLKQASLINYR
jgi:hypothetical protein